MRVAILGFGREGKAILKFLKKSPTYGGAEILICDKNRNIKHQISEYKNIKFITGENYLKNLDDFNIIFRSPGVPYNLPEIQRAVKRGVKFSSATKLFFDHFKGQVIGITGTKGKGTTATLLYQILKACGKRAYLAGNIGTPPLGLLRKTTVGARKSRAIVILELSSFQLQDLKKSPPIAVVLNIFPDHMDSHKNMKEYLDAKANIARWQKKSDKIFYFNDNKYSKGIARKSGGKKIPIRIHPGHSDEFVDLDRYLKIPGEHNLKNALMAATVAQSLGCPKDKIIKIIKNFHGNEHRLEFTRKIKGVSFYNDSASTNPQTAAAAIKAFSEPKILIAGGKDKGLNYSPLTHALKNSNTKLVILFGENKNKIQRQVSDIKCQVKLVKDLKSAVNLAYKTAKSMLHDSCFMIHVIFSPASASFDMFKDYAERGKKFKEIVRKLK